MNSKAVSTEAWTHEMLFILGAIDVHEVIRWADDSLAKSTEILSRELADLAVVYPENTEAVMRLLIILATGGDFWKALKGTIPSIIALSEDDRGFAKKSADFLDKMILRYGGESRPAEFGFISFAEDGFVLAESGQYGDIEVVHAAYLRNLKSLLKD